MSELTSVQKAIAQALVKIGERASPYSDSILLKQIRKDCRLLNKKSATVRVCDLEKAIGFLEEEGSGCWSLHLDSVNNLLIKKVEKVVLLSAEDRSNRLRSEKAMSLLTEKDLQEAQRTGGKNKAFSKGKEKSKKGKRGFDEDW